MARPLIDSPYIFGIHEPGGEGYMAAAGRPGWIVFAETLGHDPEDLSGIDYTGFAYRNLGVIAVLNHGLEPDGTLPHSSLYEAFARRAANFVATSRGCKTWVIGNEMNYAIQRPGIKVDWSRHESRRNGPAEQADPARRGLPVRFTALPDNSREIRTTRGAIISPGEVITPELYVRCFRLCREAITRLPGHADDLVLVGAVAPWNTQTIYPGNANGDWVQYFQDILALLGPEGCDGFALHAYTHGADPALISSEARLGSPFQAHHVQFRTYVDFMTAAPPEMRHLPVVLTEVGQADAWLDRNTGWVQALYTEIDAWNRQPGNQQIRAACLYRWPRLDKWYIAGKQGIEEDFQQALRNEYRWRGAAQPEEPAPPADQVIEAPPEAVAEAPELAPPAAPRRGRRSAPTAPARPYLIDWVRDEFPSQLLAGQVVVAQITVRNAGTGTWSWGGGNPVRLGYRYFRNRRVLPLPAAKDLRTDVPEDVGPGQSVVIAARVALPDEPGNYTIELDLVQEGVTWFREQGSPVLTRWLTVEAPSPTNGDGSRPSDLHLPVRLFTDISRQLPRSGAPYARRNLNQIRYIVISSTGANPRLGVDHIARAHVSRGYPGIVYDFMVDGAGRIFKVSDLEDVAQPNQAWSEQGVNVCLAGSFGHTAPPLEQLDGAGRLCAWLAQNLGLGADSIVGLGELMRSESPGATFYKGPQWKDMLTRQVKLHLAALAVGAGDAEQARELGALLDGLRSQNSVLQTSLADAQRQAAALATENQRLQSEIGDLQRHLEAQPQLLESGLPIKSLVDTLPRDASRYVLRPAESIRYLVIYHTGAAPDLPIRQIAAAHRSEWPGILYHFVIDADGTVFQTQPLDEAPRSVEPYVRESINIAFAGDFSAGDFGDGGQPTPEQLAAGGHLIATLLERYPHLDMGAVRGLSELAPGTVSPGSGWLSGRTWKNLLLTSARRSTRGLESSDTENQLRQQVAELEQTVAALELQNAESGEQRRAAVEAVRQLEDELAARVAAPMGFVVPAPAMHVVVDQLPKHPSLRYERRSLGQITHIAIHHTAAPARLGPARIAELHVAADPSRGKEAWPGIGYHFFVYEDGAIEQTNYLETASYHVLRHYGYSVGVVFAGSFMNGKIPASAQLRAGAHLVAWLMQELKIPLARVWGHREFPDNPTVCPGSEWTQGNRWRDLFFERIEQIQQGAGLKTIRHYLLFPRSGAPGAGSGDEMLGTLAYLARFQPTAGFSPDEARQAEFVTIVGGEAGVSAQVEQLLVKGGSRTERIAGRDSAETSQKFTELVRAGRRFRSFEVDF